MLLTFFSLQVVQDMVDRRHGLVHQRVQLGGGRVGDLVLVQQQEVVSLGVAPLQEAGAASPGLGSPRRARPEAGLPVGCGQGQEVVDAGLHPVPLRRQVVHFIPVDLPGRDGGADQEEQQEQQQGQVMSGMRISSLVSAVWPLVRT